MTCDGLIVKLQFFRELHFIEAGTLRPLPKSPRRCSSFESCTSLRPGMGPTTSLDPMLQFFRELHFIEA